MQNETRQVLEADGYFTEVAVRMEAEWGFVVGMKMVEAPNHQSSEDKLETIKKSVVRLGGEGHRAIASSIEIPEQWQALQAFETPKDTSRSAYLLTPGLAEVEENTRIYGLCPYDWKGWVSCAGDKQLLWGGVSTIMRKRDRDSDRRSPEFGLLPQRAFIPPGTVYVFKDRLPEPGDRRLLATQGKQQETFNKLNYGKLLWGA